MEIHVWDGTRHLHSTSNLAISNHALTSFDHRQGPINQNDWLSNLNRHRFNSILFFSSATPLLPSLFLIIKWSLSYIFTNTHTHSHKQTSTSSILCDAMKGIENLKVESLVSQNDVTLVIITTNVLIWWCCLFDQGSIVCVSERNLTYFWIFNWFSNSLSLVVVSWWGWLSPGKIRVTKANKVQSNQLPTI